MGIEPCNKQQTTSSEQPSKRRALHAIGCAKQLMRSYRSVKVDDPDGYFSSLCEVFAAFHPDVASEAAVKMPLDDKFKRFPPNAGEVRSFCEAVRKRNEATDALRAAAEKRGDVVVLPSSDRYDAIKRQALAHDTRRPFYAQPWLDPDGVLWVPKD